MPLHEFTRQDGWDLDHMTRRPLPRGWDYHDVDARQVSAKGPGGFAAIEATERPGTFRVVARGGHYATDEIAGTPATVEQFYGYIAHMARVPQLSKQEAELFARQACADARELRVGERLPDNTRIVTCSHGWLRVGRTHDGVFEVARGQGAPVRTNPCACGGGVVPERSNSGCQGVIDLSRPKRGAWEGTGYGRRYVWLYDCPACGREVKVRASTFAGGQPVPSKGGIRCERELVEHVNPVTDAHGRVFRSDYERQDAAVARDQAERDFRTPCATCGRTGMTSHYEPYPGGPHYCSAACMASGQGGGPVEGPAGVRANPRPGLALRWIVQDYPDQFILQRDGRELTGMIGIEEALAAWKHARGSGVPVIVDHMGEHPLTGELLEFFRTPRDNEEFETWQDYAWNPGGVPVRRVNGVYDPGILKAVFLAGGPGSGKSYAASELFGFGRGHGVHLSSPLGLKLVNSDPAFEMFLRRRGVDPAELATLSPERFRELTEGPDSPRSQAKRVRDEQFKAWTAGRLGIVLDGTGDDYPKIAKQREQLRQLGYDTFMVFVNTSLEVAQQRNAQRARKLPASLVEEIWRAVQQNLGSFQSLFGAENMAIVDNTVEGARARDIQKAVNAFIRRPVQNRIGREWVQRELAARGGAPVAPNRGGAPTRRNHHLAPGTPVTHARLGHGTVAEQLPGDWYRVSFASGDERVFGQDLARSNPATSWRL